MIKLIKNGCFFVNNEFVNAEETAFSSKERDSAYKKTITYSILQKHNTLKTTEKNSLLKLKFDSLASHDITYVGIVQTAKASGLTKFPVPYVLTNCHNSLCAVGGTINEDDHVFGLSAAKKYGGIFVPPHVAVIHQYMREMMAGSGKMILGSDSHTRYGAFGTIAIGEGGPELVKQILNQTYDIKYPEVVAVYLKGKVKKGVGPQDVALALIGATFKNAFVKNCILEFIGDGIKNLSVDFRSGIDVMTTETTCLSSVWQTDKKVQDYLQDAGRIDDYALLESKNGAYYDKAIVIDLDKIVPMIAMPFHPSNVYTIEDVNNNTMDILHEVEVNVSKQLDNPNINYKLTDKVKNNRLHVEQAIIAGCAGGTYENIVEAAEILHSSSIGNDEFTLSVYPSSLPIFDRLASGGQVSSLMQSGAIIKTAFCGPCFGAGDTPANNSFSIRHTTRNFPNREGSKPNQNQIASVALMDARSIAATSLNHGKLTAATDIDYDNTIPKYEFNKEIYKKRVYFGYEKPDKKTDLKYGPNIADWPQMIALQENMVLKVVCSIHDEVTTTDELIPSGETSSYRSNPLKLAEFTLSRKDPNYVANAKSVATIEENRRNNKHIDIKELEHLKIDYSKTSIGSVIFAKKPGDGSAREQAASCQRVLFGAANIANEYATKRYRSNLINWGMLPFISQDTDFVVGDYIYIKDIKTQFINNKFEFAAILVRDGKDRNIQLSIDSLTDDEKQIILDGSLINFYKNKRKS